MKTISYKCEVVVVGTGAGGAVAGAKLAESGVDTIIVEEGKYDTKETHSKRGVFSGFVNTYLSAGATLAIGSPPISLTFGSAVGGTTAINSSTCFRPPREKVESWGGPDWDEMTPYFEEVERRINAHYVDEELLGGNWTVMKRGCDALGVEIKPLMHNVKDCKARGRCQFGCPEGAKQSTDVSFIPGAIDAGATLLTSHFVDGLLIEKGRAVGVVGRNGENRFKIRAKKVVLSMGATRTPVFLLKKRLANSSRRVGKGLQIHPAVRVAAEFDEIINGHKGLPQGAFIDHWADRGIMLEGIFLPPGIMMTSLPFTGKEFKEVAAAYNRLSAFGVMVSDTKSGFVRPGHFGSPGLIFYQLGKEDARTLKFGIARIAEIYLAAGAKRIFTGFHRVSIVDDAESLARLEKSDFNTGDLEVAAFHPLGTCPMGSDPRTSVVDFSLETHDVKDLYVIDGSVVPGSLGVNPQITIMSLALRAAGILAQKA